MTRSFYLTEFHKHVRSITTYLHTVMNTHSALFHNNRQNLFRRFGSKCWRYSRRYLGYLCRKWKQSVSCRLSAIFYVTSLGCIVYVSAILVLYKAILLSVFWDYWYCKGLIRRTFICSRISVITGFTCIGFEYRT